MADYKLFVPFVLKWEGGWADDKDDRGGKTNMGITYSTYKTLSSKVLGVSPSLERFKALTKQQAAIFVKWFWDKATYGNSIKSQAVAESITSWYWGSGSYGIKQWQRMLRDVFKKNISVDGVVGPQTISATNSIPENKLVPAAIEYRGKTFKQITLNDSSQVKFLKGWMNRLNDFAQRHSSLIKKSAVIGTPILLIATGLAFFFLNLN
jgi:type VI secretion system secreted protein VgrG